jgi:selenocysteine lyase/cysteine desulfurase
VEGRSAVDLARDEGFWREIQAAFSVDRNLINLNNGGVGLATRGVHEAFTRYLDVSNQAPPHYMWSVVGGNLETVRRRLAAAADCSPEEIALTRNTTEALANVQMGLDLKAGDEVLMTDQEHPGEDTRWEQRARREGIRLVKVPFPTPPDRPSDLTQRFEEGITPRTKLVFFAQVTWKTGQIFPVKEICAMARERGIPTIVDGAHGFGHFPMSLRDLGCDYYGTSLHKWLGAPVGTGFLFIRRENIEKVFPIMGAPPRLHADIRKFEWSIGTYPAANWAAISEALTFQNTLGLERKAERLRYLKNRWAERVRKLPNVQLATSLDPDQSCAIGTVSIDGVDPVKLTKELWDRHRILVVPRTQEKQFAGIRVTPHLYTTLDEVDLFASALEEAALSPSAGRRPPQRVPEREALGVGPQRTD